MAKKYSRGPNKAKVLVSDPRYRARQEKPAKGKGSYRREAFSLQDEKASVFLAACKPRPDASTRAVLR